MKLNKADKHPAVKLAKKLDWDIKITKKGHIRAECPYGCCLVYISGTPSDFRGQRKSIVDIERCKRMRDKND